MENQSTIIKLDNITGITYNNANNVQVRSASFEEAFGDFSEARGDRRKRRHKRRMERLAEKRERKAAKRLLKSDRQEARAERRAKRRRSRDDQRLERTEARLTRKKRRSEGRVERKKIKEEGANDRENYALEQEIGRDNKLPEDNTQEEQGGGQQEEQGGGYQEEQGGGQQTQGGGYQEEQGGGQDYNSAPQGYSGEEEEEPYSQEESEFSDGNNFSGLDGMEDEEVSYLEDDYSYAEDEDYEDFDDEDDEDPNVNDAVRKLSNNQQAYDDLRTTRDELLENGSDTSNIDGEIEKCYGRICEIENQLDDYSNADGKSVLEVAKLKRQIANQKMRNDNKRRRRRNKMLALKMKGKKLANMIPAVRLAKALREARKKKAEGTEVKTGFDSFSQIGRPVIYNGQELSDGDASDYYEDDEFENPDNNYELSDNYYLNASGTTNKSNSLLSIAIGVGIGVGLLYLAKRKNLI